MAIDRRALFAGGLVLAAGASGYYYYTEQRDSRRYGVVEIGSGGAKWSVIKLNHVRVEQLARAGGQTEASGARIQRYRRTELAGGDFPVDVRDANNVSDTVQALAAAVREVRNHAAGDRFVIVGSSSLPTMDHWPTLQQELNEKALELTERPFETVTVEQELEYLFRWVVPQGNRYNSSIIDIGSGNLKAGYMVHGTSDRFEQFAIEYGASSLAREAARRAEATGASFREALTAACQETIGAELGRRAPRGLIRPVIYLSGGSSWAASTVMKPRATLNAEFWVPLTAAELADYHDIAFADPSFMTAMDQYEPGSEERTAIDDVKRAFPQDERILAGAEILFTLSRILNFEDRRVFFTTEGQFAWSTMHLLVKLRMEQPT